MQRVMGAFAEALVPDPRSNAAPKGGFQDLWLLSWECYGMLRVFYIKESRIIQVPCLGASWIWNLLIFV